MNSVYRTLLSSLLLPVPISLSYSTMRLAAVEGHAGRTNDIVYSVSKQHQQPSDVVVFFPGDIQNYPELMAGHCAEEDIPHWNLEAVAQDLSRKMPTKDIIVVKPSRTVKGVYNHYDNFVTMNQFGGPDYLKHRSALPHIFQLILNVLGVVRPDLQQEKPHQEGSCHTTHEAQASPASCSAELEYLTMTKESRNEDDDQQSCPVNGQDYGGSVINSISLVGFSKGCVVLNQLLTEIYLMSELPEEDKQLCTSLLQKVTEMAWLDGGHQGREGTWVINPNFIKKLVKTLPHLNITIHVTPYQMSDPDRPWIGNECRRFVSLCQEATTNVSYTLHGDEDERASLHTHFKALDAYGAS